jgi:hypothetical protein
MPTGLLVAALLLGASFGCRESQPPQTAGDEPDPTPRVTLPDESMFEASPSDGGGDVAVTPKSVEVGKPCTLTFVYTAGEHGIVRGGGVLCYVSSFWYWTPPQSTDPQMPGYMTVSASSPEVKLSVTTDSSSQTALALIEDGQLHPGDRITFVYGDTTEGSFPNARGMADRFAERDERFYFKVDGDGDGWFVPITRQPSFTVTPAEPVQLACFGPSTVASGDRFELRISALDAARNLANEMVGEVNLVFDESVLDAPKAVRFEPDDRGSVGVPVRALAPGVARVKLHDQSQQLTPATSNVIVIHEPGQRRYNLLWADLQIHGNISDGSGAPEDLYRYARDVARLDVAAVTEHDHCGYLPLDQNKSAWQRILSTASACYQEGRFVTFPAYEWTSWTFGHQHILFAHEKDAVPRSWHDPASDHPLELLAALDGTDCVAVPHHPGGGPIPFCWKYHHPGLQPVVEIVSVHGVSERTGAAGGIRQPVPSGMAQAALARGHRLGFIGGGDTHDGHPGLGSPGMPAPGLAGIYAEETSRQAVLAALRARRVYATSGCRAILRFHSGPVAMGGAIKADKLSAPVTLDIALVGDAPIESLTIIKSNRDAAVIKGEGMVMALSWTDTDTARPGDYYYLRVMQADSCQIWSSPIWIE